MGAREDIVKSKEELNRLNRELGFKRRDDGGTAPPNEGNHSNPPNEAPSGGSGGEQPGPADAGPPRFIGVNFDQRVAGLSGGSAIVVSDEAVSKIVDILLSELRSALDASHMAVARTHGRIDAQLPIPFEEPKE